MAPSNSESVASAVQAPAADVAALDCPPCKQGAPAWMATFADMATLLMAFFVLILSFAHVNVPKYKEVSGSMRSAFGVQTKVPVVEPPTADSLVAQYFKSSSVNVTAIKTIEERKTDQPQPVDVEQRQDDGKSISELNAAEEMVERSLQEFIAEGQVEVTSGNNRIEVHVLDVNQEGTLTTASNGMPATQITREALFIYAKVAQAQTQTEVLIEVIEGSTGMERVASEDSRPGPSTMPNSVLEDRYRQIRANLGDEISKGLAEVAKEGDEIIIRLAERATFVSGRADLREDFYGLIDKVGRSVRPAGGEVTIEGHTDDVPVAFSSRFRDNWDLSAARAAAVADYLLQHRFLEPGRVSVRGYADTRPLQDNDTEGGRTANRRVEIIVSGF